MGAFQELLKLVRRVRDAEREAISTVFEILAEEGIRRIERMTPPEGQKELGQKDNGTILDKW